MNILISEDRKDRYDDVGIHNGNDDGRSAYSNKDVNPILFDGGSASILWSYHYIYQQPSSIES